MAELYTYQVARVRSRELTLLGRQDIDQLMAAKSYDECLRILKDKGWGSSGENTGEEILSGENKKTWDFIDELVKDLSPFDVLIYPIDFNNIKAAIKAGASGTEPHNVFKSGGELDTDKLVKCVKDNDFSSLPVEMASAAKEAYRTLLQTRDGQLCDIIIDRACLEAIKKAGENSEDKLIKQYAVLSVAIADIKIAFRCVKTKKSLNFVRDALCPCDGLNIDSLATAATKSIDDVYSYLSGTAYSEASEKMKESASAFEKWCDDKMMDMIKGQKSNPFTIGPIMAYVIARQNEISTVRILLSGKLNNLDDKVIRERLREMYV